MAAGSSPSQARLDSLTGLRFLAAGAVFVHHTWAPTLLSTGVVHIMGTRRLGVVGYVGVTTFFVLSGVVLAWSWDERRTTGGFYGRRFARVWPLHALMWASAVLVVLPITGKAVGGHGTSAGQNVAGLALVQGWVPDPKWYFAGNFPSWSLSCEAFFYALLPALVPLLRRAGRRAAVITVSGCVTVLALAPLAMLAATDRTYSLLTLAIHPAYRAEEFVIGVVLGWALKSGWRPSWTLWQAATGATVAYVGAAALAGGLFFADNRSHRALGNMYADLIFVLPAAALIAALAARDLSGRPTWLSRPLPVTLGAASFAFYLVHAQILLLLAEAPLHLRRELHGLPMFVIALGLSVAASLALHRYVERPAEGALRRRIVARERRHRDAAGLASEPA